MASLTVVSKRTICGDKNALFLAVLDQVILGKERMRFDLVHSLDDIASEYSLEIEQGL